MPQMKYFDEASQTWKPLAPTQTEFDTFKTTTNGVLADKATKTEVDSKILSLGQLKLSGQFDTLAALQTAIPTGTADMLYLVIADGFTYRWLNGAWTKGAIFQAQGIATKGVKTTNLDEKAVTVTKTDFLKVGKNKFDYKKAVIGFYVDTLKGGLDPDSGFAASGFIPVEPNTSYKKTAGRAYAFYDSGYSFISSSPSGASFTTPVNAAYVRLTIRYPYETASPDGTIDKYMFVKSTDTLDYEPYYEELENPNPKKITADKIEPKAVVEGLIADDSISKRAIKGLIPVGNLLDSEKYTVGKYLYNDNGKLGEQIDANYICQILKVGPNKKYSFTFGRFVVELLADKSTVVKQSTSITTVTTSATTEYLAVSFNKTAYPTETFMIVEGELPSSYIENQYKIPWLYVPTPAPTQNAANPIVNLPAIIPAVVGKELNIYFKNLTQVNMSRYNIKCTVTGGSGRQYKDRFSYTPTAAGTKTITISFYDEDGNLKGESTSTINIKAANVGSGVNKKFLLIGDSTVSSNGTGDITNRLLTNFNADVMDITLLGSLGTAPNLHEGRGGWAAKEYRLATVHNSIVNPFYNPAKSDFDFSYYMTQKGYTSVDYVVIELGINDMFYAKSELEMNAAIASTLTNYSAMVNSIKSFNANIKIGINMTIPPNDSQDAFAIAYDSTYDTQWRYKRNNAFWVQKLIEHFSSVSNVYLIPVHMVIDTGVNIADALHPKNAGYNQISDMDYFWLKSFEV